MANTTNFGWETPDDTDLVKDGAAAMRTLGSAIDTSMADLKGGTTGQALLKNSNTDMDFVWTTMTADITGVTAGTGLSGGGTSGDVTLTNTMATAIDAKGDLVVGTGADTFSRLAVGTNNQVLIADSTAATGIKWGSAPISSVNWTLLNAGGTTLTGATTITVSGITDKEYIKVLIANASSANASSSIGLRINTDSTANYDSWGISNNAPTTYAGSQLTGLNNGGGNMIPLADMSTNAGSLVNAGVTIDGGTNTGNKGYISMGAASAAAGNSQIQYMLQGIYKGSAKITSISVVSSSGNFDGGTVYVYGA